MNILKKRGKNRPIIMENNNLSRIKQLQKLKAKNNLRKIKLCNSLSKNKLKLNWNT